jgi:hypothetical protein
MIENQFYYSARRIYSEHMHETLDILNFQFVKFPYPGQKKSVQSPTLVGDQMPLPTGHTWETLVVEKRKKNSPSNTGFELPLCPKYCLFIIKI